MSSDAKDRVVENYAAQKPNSKRDGRVDWSYTTYNSAYGSGGVQLFCDGPVLYSYGSHFPLATIVGIEKAGTKSERFLFAKNGDRFSSTTSGHQAMTQRVCEGPTVSYGALSAAGIDFLDLRLQPSRKYRITAAPKKIERSYPPVILFWQADSRQYVWRHTDGSFTLAHEHPPKKFTPPAQGMFVPTHNNTGDKDQGRQYGYWHVLGAAVIEHKSKYYLCGLDDGSYFVCELTGRPRSCEHAYEMLKPREVKKAEAEGVEVLRQGEWFFVPTGMKDEDLAATLEWSKTKLKQQTNNEALPVQRTGSTGSNLHVCRQVKLQGGKRIYVKGKVFHRHPFGDHPLTGQHPTVNLGDEWHIAYHNTEVRSWSQGGTFD